MACLVGILWNTSRDDQSLDWYTVDHFNGVQDRGYVHVDRYGMGENGELLVLYSRLLLIRVVQFKVNRVVVSKVHKSFG